MTDSRRSADARESATTRSTTGRHLTRSSSRPVSPETSRRQMYAAGLTVLGLLVGSLAVFGSPADAGYTSPAVTAASGTTARAVSVHNVDSTVVHRVGRIAGASARLSRAGSVPTASNRIRVTVRVIMSSTVRASATVTDGVDSETEVRSVRVTRSVTRFSSARSRATQNAARTQASRAAWVVARTQADAAATQLATTAAVSAARVTFTRKHPQPPASAPSASPSTVSVSPTPSDTSAPIPTDTTAPTTTPTPSSTTTSAAPAPTTPTPSVATPTVTAADPNAMPVGNLTGWKQVFADDFTKPAALGSFLSTYGSTWFAYPSPWKDTSKNGTYDPAKTLSVANGMLDIYVHTENGVHYVSAPQPKLPTMTYGRYSVRFQADSTAGYKTAWLLWPDSGVWPGDGEIDFPEGDLNQSFNAFAHYASSGGGQDAFSLSTTFTGWHIATVDWTPGKIVFYLDGKVIGTSTKMVPSHPMHWVLQTETTLSGAVPSSSVSGHVRVDWATAYTYAP